MTKTELVVLQIRYDADLHDSPQAWHWNDLCTEAESVLVLPKLPSPGDVR